MPSKADFEAGEVTVYRNETADIDHVSAISCVLLLLSADDRSRFVQSLALE